MNDLVFGISLKNHTLNIQITPRSTLCCYHNEGKYTTSLIFAANTYASVEYKNIKFCGRVTKQSIWHVDLDYRPIVSKRYNRCNFLLNESSQNEDEKELPCNVTTEPPDKIVWLYNQLITFLQEYYLPIEDKEAFKRQLCEILLTRYSDVEIEDLDRIVEYENWDGVEADEDPIIEKASLRNVLTEDCKNFFTCFKQAEMDNKNKDTIITLENIIHHTPILLQIPYDLLKKEFCAFLDKNHADLLKPDVWYYQEEALIDIGEEIYESCLYTLFLSTVETRIDTILSEMDAENIDKEELYSYFKAHYSKGSTPSDEEFEISVKEFVGEHIAFHQIYSKFVSLFNNNHIKLEWDDEKLSLFHKYDEEGKVADPQNLAEYEAYRFVVPFYRKHFLRKNSKRYKPVIEQLPAFTSYASTVIDILFKHKIITDNTDAVAYNADGNFELAYKEITVLDEKIQQISHGKTSHT